MVADTSSPLMPEKLDLMARRLIWLKAPKAPRHISQFSHEIIWIDLPEIPCFRLLEYIQPITFFIPIKRGVYQLDLRSLCSLSL